MIVAVVVDVVAAAVIVACRLLLLVVAVACLRWCPLVGMCQSDHSTVLLISFSSFLSIGPRHSILNLSGYSLHEGSTNPF